MQAFPKGGENQAEISEMDLKLCFVNPRREFLQVYPGLRVGVGRETSLFSHLLPISRKWTSEDLALMVLVSTSCKRYALLEAWFGT